MFSVLWVYISYVKPLLPELEKGRNWTVLGDTFSNDSLNDDPSILFQLDSDYYSFLIDSLLEKKLVSNTDYISLLSTCLKKSSITTNIIKSNFTIIVGNTLAFLSNMNFSQCVFYVFVTLISFIWFNKIYFLPFLWCC